jgi:GT2 family glycosyltransferase
MLLNRLKVSIVLLNYNGYKDTIDCFKSLQKITYQNYDVIIVDNDSPNKSMDKIIEYMKNNDIDYDFYLSPGDAMSENPVTSKVHLIQSGENKGYGHGNNIGIKYTLQNNADYTLVLNNDTIVTPDFLEPMVTMCENDKNIGIASGKILFYDKPDTIWFNGGSYSPCTAKVKHFNFNEKDIGQVPKEPITFISGCMWLIPRKTFEKVGYINENYFMYVEDLEFCQRVLKKGYKLKVTKDGNVYHKVGSSTGGQFLSFSVYWRVRNMNKLIATIKSLPCKLSAYSIFNLKMIFLLIRAKKTKLLKNYFNAIINFKKDTNVT